MPKPHITIKIRVETLERIKAKQARHIGETGKVISRAEYIDRLSRLQLAN